MLALAFLNAVGLTLAISWSKIFNGFRAWLYDKSEFFYDLVTCPFCLGFYITTVMLFLHWIDPIIMYWLGGLTGSVLSYTIYKRLFQE